MRHMLLVDDERAVVEGLKKVLRPWRETWAVEVAIGGRAALDALGSGRRFDAVVSDARMPEIDGEMVLRAARDQQRDAVRVVLSGQVDANTGHRLASVCHQFLTKPSSAEAIIAAVEACCRLCDSLGDDSARRLVASLGPLPLAPSVYHRISALIDGPNTSIDEVVAIVGEDIALTASVLRFVASALFGLTRPVVSIRDAVVLLGLEKLRELVLISELLPQESQPLLEEVRTRSLFRAQLARLITQGSPVTHLAAEASLLADVGLYALAWKQPDRYAAVWERFRAGAGPLTALEFEAFGATHAQVGAVLLGLWGLPQTVVNAVRWHEDTPPTGAGLDACTATALATALDWEFHRGVTAPGVELLTAQLGLQQQLTMFREFTARAWRGRGAA